MYYGYHEDFDIFSSSNPVPASGALRDYTSARVVHTIDWCIRNLPVDSTRTYMTGFSLGAIGALFTAVTIPSRIAAIAVFCPRVSFAVPFRYNGWDEAICDRLYGMPATDLPTNEAMTRNQRLDANYLLDRGRRSSMPVIYTFCGKTDADVDWDEKIPFYGTMRNDRHGGFHFWGPGDHGGTAYNSPWRTEFPDFSFFTRYRTNRSYPAFSSCTADGNPGSGSPSDGDSIGTINGHLDFDDGIVDSARRWECTLRLKDLLTVYGTLAAPDSAVVDVTPRRTQAFLVPPGATVHWRNFRDSVLVQEGDIVAPDGPLTVPGVKVYRTGGTVKLALPPELTVPVDLSDRWNLVSRPLAVVNDSVGVLFPGALSKAVGYDPGSGYRDGETMERGRGYWLKSDGAHTVMMTGQAAGSDTIEVSPEWNMIGSIGTPVAAALITSIPGGLVTTRFFGYAGNYRAADTIAPGKGYWVKVGMGGRLVLAWAPGSCAVGRIRIVPTGELPPAFGGAISVGQSVLPSLFVLRQNYPNPFNPTTEIRYALPAPAYVTLVVYNMLGEKVATLIDGMQALGERSARFDAHRLPSGVYAYRLTAGERSEAKTMVVLK